MCFEMASEKGSRWERGVEGGGKEAFGVWAPQGMVASKQRKGSRVYEGYVCFEITSRKGKGRGSDADKRCVVYGCLKVCVREG